MNKCGGILTGSEDWLIDPAIAQPLRSPEEWRERREYGFCNRCGSIAQKQHIDGDGHCLECALKLASAKPCPTPGCGRKMLGNFTIQRRGETIAVCGACKLMSQLFDPEDEA